MGDVKIIHKKSELPTVSEILTNSNITKYKIGSLMFIITNLYYIFADYFSGLLSEPYGFLDLTGSLILLIASLSIFIITLIKKCIQNKKLMNILFFSYNLLMILSVSLYLFAFNNRAIIYEIPINYIGITLSSTYLLFIMICPFENKYYTYITIVAIFLSYILVYFINYHQELNIFPQLIYRIIITVGYLYFRKSYKSSVQKRIDNELLNNKLIHLSYVDSLTQTLNRYALERCMIRIKENLHRFKNISVLMIDIDYFKNYNDFFTHVKGDEVLLKICKAISKNLDSTKDFLFRYGGEEFVVILDNFSIEQLIDLGLKIKHSVEELKISRDGDNTQFPYVTISIGATILTMQELLNKDYIYRSDKELYNAKNNGRNCLSYNGKIYK